ncbi:MAG: type IV pilus secretin PilQ [Vicinamibacteraceae bacterium]|nr:type IV pilus secretin PilQ [Vicinamibacteraceae bacterium]
MAPPLGALLAPVVHAAQATARIASITTQPTNGDLRVVIKGTAPLTPKSVEEAKDPPARLVLDFADVASDVPSVIPVGKNGVRRIRVAPNSASPLVTRVVFDLTGPVTYKVEPGAASDLIVTVTPKTPPAAAASATAAPVAAKPAAEPKAPAAAAAKPASPAPATPAPAPKARRTARAAKPPAAPAPTPAKAPAPAPVAGAATPAEPPPPPSRAAAARAVTEGGFSGHPVSLDFQGVDLRAVLRTFAEISGLNIVIDPAVQGSVDVALREVPWDQALDMILRANQLGYTVEGSIVRVAPLSRLRQEEEEKRKLSDAKALSGELETKTRTLNYARARAVEVLLKNVLSTRGRTAVDERTNMLIITDLPEHLIRVDALLDALDQAELQVEIEARIVQTTKRFARELGISWGFSGAMTPELGNTSPWAFPNSGTVNGGVNAPTRPINPTTGAIGVGLSAINGAFNLDVELSALEREGKIRTLLTPRVVTQNNVKATITRGQEIPYTTTVAAPVGDVSYIQPIPTVQFKTAALTLAVTPRITNANTVILDVDVDNGSPGEAEANGNRAINTQRAQTTVLVADGATTVIGGIQTNSEAVSQDNVPGLSKLPLVGRLFRNDIKSLDEEEILIFITPRIIRIQ